VLQGTVDSASGALHLVGPDYNDPLFGPIPGVVVDAALQDDDHFAGTYTYSYTKITPPPCIPYCRIVDPLTAMRGAPVCGDGIVDPGERCDDGAANGTDGCCDASCMPVDTDGDGICDAQDDCPQYADPAQDDSCRAGTATLRHVSVVAPSGLGTGDGYALLRGTLAGRDAVLGDVGLALLSAGSTGAALTPPVCVPIGSRRISCHSADDLTTFDVTTGRTGARMRFRARIPLNLGGPPAAGPVELLLYGTGAQLGQLLWRGIVDDCCTAHGGALVCRGR
jgi:cysteine-rich repeat protein